MRRIIAIYGGGDWADASVEHIEASDGLDLRQEQDLYDEWYFLIYCNEKNKVWPKIIEYESFADWLISRNKAKLADIEHWGRDD